MAVGRDRAFKVVFDVAQRFGVHVVRNHYFEPVPDTRRFPDRLWERRVELPGIDFDYAGQLERMETFRSLYRDEYETLDKQTALDVPAYSFANPQFTTVDAEALYCMVRHFKPRRIIEIGGGNSTLVSSTAVRRNASEDASYACDFTVIEPFPGEILRGGVPEVSRLLATPVQDVPMSVFESLGENDILFIDTTHVLKTGSDVQYEFLEVLPRMAAGVVVQVHDIFLPDEYPRHLLVDWHRFWNEQYLLQSFLMHNDSYRVLWMSYYLNRDKPDRVGAAFRSYRESRWTTGLPPSSFWMQRVR